MKATNTVASEACLLRHLALTPYIWFQMGFCLFATYFSMIAEGWIYWGYPLFVFVFLVNIRVEWGNYRAAGMTRSHWRRHRRILVSVTVVLVLLAVAVLGSAGDLPVNPVLLVAVPAAWAWTMLHRQEPSRSIEEIIEGAGAVENYDAGDAGPERSRFPLTPVQQIIRGPQVTMWILVWGVAAFAVLVLGVLSWLLDEPPEWVSALFPLVGVPATWLIMGQIGDSLREWVAFGGSRRLWARETVVLGLLSPVITGIIAVIAGAIFDIDSVFEVLPFVLGIAFLVPILFTLVELSDLRRTWWASLPYVGLGGGLLALWDTDSIGKWGFLAGCAALYLIHALTLPVVARNYTVFSGGITAWLGVRREARV